MDLKPYPHLHLPAETLLQKAGNFILKYLAIRVISASLKSSPNVLQQVSTGSTINFLKDFLVNLLGYLV